MAVNLGAVPSAPTASDTGSLTAPSGGASGGATGNAEGGSQQWAVVQVLQTAAHPVTCVFHAAFKIMVLIVYIFGRYVSLFGFEIGYVTTFIFTTIFAALDFWTVKNVTGRLLVGLRWWNHVRDDGTSEWVFESNPEETAVNSTDRNIFWTLVYSWPLLWALFLFLNLLQFSFDWVLLCFMVLVFGASNFAGYYKCSKDAKKRARDWVERQGIRAVAGAMGF
eukprot:TRINITY_DN31809_c0_g1_i1.p1 TRINITY_DN31809_c0_g1~~TRINITY_DN31809_c0_g1_i1.p1  ORF type:complete len:222 (+),score=34.95 TRINITY_DN31809_c0_g1_i1:157-822(+)